MDTQTLIGEEIRAQAARHRFTAGSLWAAMDGLPGAPSRGALYRMWKGESPWTIEAVLASARVMDIDPGELLAEAGRQASIRGAETLLPNAARTGNQRNALLMKLHTWPRLGVDQGEDRYAVAPRALQAAPVRNDVADIRRLAWRRHLSARSFTVCTDRVVSLRTITTCDEAAAIVRLAVQPES